jgi:hypothetical protein
MKRIADLDRTLRFLRAKSLRADYAQTVVLTPFISVPHRRRSRTYAIDFKRNWLVSSAKVFRGMPKCTD